MRRILLTATLLCVVPLLTAACASIAGLGDVPNVVDGGVHDVTTHDVSHTDATRDAKPDAMRDASSDVIVRRVDAGFDAGVDASPGCQSPTDCPLGEACNSMTGACGTACSAGTACNGGCCSNAVGGTCLGGEDAGACGSGGSVCTVCTGATSSCSGGTCVGNCSGTGCATGECCVSGGMCQAGNTPTSCGSKTACADCTGDSHGFVCKDGGTCGCATEADCPLHTACNSNHLCVTKCRYTDGGTVSPCNGGCCNYMGTCATGTGNMSCGEGMVCSVCAGMNGAACLDGGTCGCRTQFDCDVANTCTNGECTPSCGGPENSPCRLGCCKGGTCQAGDLAAACGKSGGACLDCTTGCGGGSGGGIECNQLPGSNAFACSCKTTGANCPSAVCGGRTMCVPYTIDGGTSVIGRCETGS